MKKVLDFARSELNHYYHLVTGENEPNIQLIVDASLAEASDDCALDDWFSISVNGDTGHIKGINARSVLIGVYRFFRELGCVFTRPGQDGEKIVQCEKENISVSLVCKPHNRFRTITIEGGNSIEDVLDLIDWSIKMGLIPISHNLGIAILFSNIGTTMNAIRSRKIEIIFRNSNRRSF